MNAQADAKKAHRAQMETLKAQKAAAIAEKESAKHLEIIGVPSTNEGKTKREDKGDWAML